MPRYNKQCTKCGNKLHNKQVAFSLDVRVQTYSCLVAEAEKYKVVFCKECTANLLKHCMDCLLLSDFNRLIKRYGEKL